MNIVTRKLAVFLLLALLFLVITTSNSFANWEESLNFKFDGREWAQVDKKTDASGWLIVFVPKGQSKDTWTERFVYHYTEAPKAFTPQEFYDLNIADLKMGKEFSSAIIDKNETNILFKMSVQNAPHFPNFFELQRFLIGKRAFHSIKYSIKGNIYSKEKESQWIQLMRSATINYREVP